MPKKRGPYLTLARAAADEEIELRLRVMELGRAKWLQFCDEVLEGQTAQDVRPHGNRRVVRAAVLESWRRRGVSSSAAADRFEKLEREWSDLPQRVIFDFRYHIGMHFGPTLVDEIMHGPFAAPPDPPMPTPGSPGVDPRKNPLPPMIRQAPLAPPSVRADTFLLLAWIEWLGERGRAAELVTTDRRTVTRASRRARGTPKM